MARTNSQIMAEKAYQSVLDRTSSREFPEYRSFSRSFPSLVHACGLAQTIAFARAKKHDDYLLDLSSVLNAAGYLDPGTVDNLETKSIGEPVSQYIHLCRNALHAANWIKRYVEALEENSNAASDSTDGLGT